MPAAEAQSRATQLLEVLDLTGDGHRLVADYSTGMRKKAALGCALIHNPGVLFLDEPLEGVDPVSADVIRRLLTRYVGSGSTVLFSSHVMELVEQVCDHVSIINEGRIVATGTTDQVPGRQDPAAGFHRPGRIARGRGGGTVMAWVLVQLKLKLLTNALRSSQRARVSFVVSSIFALIVAAGTFVLLALLHGATAVTLTAAIFTVFAFGWLLLPVMLFGLDGTLDPATLALYPLRTRPLAIGLLAASATGAWPVANVIGLLGVTVGLAAAPSASSSPWSRSCWRCCSASRWPGCSPSAWPGCCGRAAARTSPRFCHPVFALYELLVQLIPRLAAEGRITGRTFAGPDRWLRWLPPGLAAHAIQDASDGHAGTAFALLALLAAVVIVLGALWVRSLHRALVTVDTTTQSSAVRGGSLPFGRYGLAGSVARRFLVYQRRDPASVIRWCIVAVVMGAASVAAIRTPHYAVGLVLSAVLGGGMIGLMQSNSIGFTGPRSGWRRRV